ncbi:MAG TPA: universal stress protein [Solirubrobacterales bacterium]|nr:universal stress protein [Solirubrobacterales bacterium]
MALRVPRDQSLQRVHGVGSLFSAAYGNVGSSIYYALGVVAAFALGLTPIAFMISGLIFVCTAATYVEGTVMDPKAGGSASFARHAFNEMVSFVAGWGQMMNYIITVAISAFFVPHYLGVFWEPLRESPGDIIGGIVLIAALAALNIKGTQESSRLNLVLAIGDLATQVLLVVVGLALVFNGDVLIANIDLGVAPTWGDFALGIALGMIAYTGIETISNMSEEAVEPERSIPRGAGLVVLAVIGLYALLPMIALSAMPVTLGPDGYTTELGTKFAGDPVLGIVENLGLGAALTDGLRIYVGILAAVILVIATNAGMIGVSRLTFSMGQHRQLPERLRQVHPRFRTPHVAIITFSIIASIALLPGQADLLATMYSFGAMLSFTIAHAAILWMRRRLPDQDRPWKPPGEVRIAGVAVPLTAVLGGFGTFAAWIVVMAMNPVTMAIGLGWMLLGSCVYLGYRRRHNLPITKTVEIKFPEALDVEVEIKSVLVPFEDDPFSEQTIGTAARLADRKGRPIHVLSLLNVPAHLPIDALLPRQQEKAQSKIERAKLIGGRRVTGHVMRVRPGQAPKAIIETAKEMDAVAIVMQLTYRNGAPLYGKTLEGVLANRPCRVIVAGDPTGSAAPAGTPAAI